MTAAKPKYDNEVCPYHLHIRDNLRARAICFIRFASPLSSSVALQGSIFCPLLFARSGIQSSVARMLNAKLSIRNFGGIERDEQG